MAKATITIEDTDDGEVNVKLHFDPPVDNQDPENNTTAQCLAASAVEFLADQFGGEAQD